MAQFLGQVVERHISGFHHIGAFRQALGQACTLLGQNDCPAGSESSLTGFGIPKPADL